MNDKWYVVQDWGFDGLRVFVAREIPEGRFTLRYGPPELIKYEPTQLSEPSFTLTDDAAQQLMNGLWHAGVRPKDGSSSLAHIDAMKAHLEDMRTLVFQRTNP